MALSSTIDYYAAGSQNEEKLMTDAPQTISIPEAARVLGIGRNCAYDAARGTGFAGTCDGCG